MGQADALYQIENAQVGYRENNGSSNHNNYQKYSPGVPGLEWSQYQAWCMTMQSWCLRQAGLSSLGPVTASTATGYQWYANKGRASAYPAVGAFVFFGPGAGSHVGFVYAYDGTYIYTIEGNTNTNGSAEGDGVYKKVRVRRDDYVYGYGYPAYAEGIVTADPKHAVSGSRYAATASLSLTAGTTAPSTAPWISLIQVQWAATHSSSDENRQTGDTSKDDVARVQDALVKLKFLTKITERGVFNPQDKTAYQNFQKSLGYTGGDADGIPGTTSLVALGNKTQLFQVRDTAGTFKPTLKSATPAAPAKPWVWADVGSVKGDKYTDEPGSVQIVRNALNKEFKTSITSTTWDSALVALYAKWQKSLGYSGSDADGYTGKTSLTKLATKYGFDIHGNFPDAPASTPGAISPSQVLFTRDNGGAIDVEDTVRKACAAQGYTFSQAWVNGYRTAMSRESAGDPNACNTYDLNAINPPGYSSVHDYGNNGVFGPSFNGGLVKFQCSRGAWQCIPQTFATNHAPGTSLSIYDRVASCAASMKYVVTNYGVAKDGSNLASRVQQFDPNRSPKGY